MSTIENSSSSEDPLYYSSINPKKEINEHFSRITMICDAEAGPFLGSQHALIALEVLETPLKGVERVAKWLIHLVKNSEEPTIIFKRKKWYKLTGDIGSVQIRRISESGYRWTNKSKTYRITAAKARRLIDKSIKECENPLKYPQPFSMMGNKLADAAPNEKPLLIRNRFIKELADTDPEVFLTLCRKAQRCIDYGTFEKLGKGYFYACYVKHGGIDVANQTINTVFKYKKGKVEGKKSRVRFNKTISIKRREEILDLYLQTCNEADRTKLWDEAPPEDKAFFEQINITLTQEIEVKGDLLCNKEFKLIPTLEKIRKRYIEKNVAFAAQILTWKEGLEEKPFHTVQKIIELVAGTVEFYNGPMHSCFTWARANFDLVGAPIPGAQIFGLVAITRVSLPRREDPDHDEPGEKVTVGLTQEQKYKYTNYGYYANPYDKSGKAYDKYGNPYKKSGDAYANYQNPYKGSCAYGGNDKGNQAEMKALVDKKKED